MMKESVDVHKRFKISEWICQRDEIFKNTHSVEWMFFYIKSAL